MSAPTAARFTPAEIAEAVAKRVARVGDFDDNLVRPFARHGVELAADGFTITTEGGQTFHLTVAETSVADRAAEVRHGVEQIADALHTTPADVVDQLRDVVSGLQRDEGGEYPCSYCGTRGWDCLTAMNGSEVQQRCCRECGINPTHGRPAETTEVLALRMHLASVHKVANAFALSAADLDDVHQHDHFGPCGLRNHDVADHSFDESEARAVVAEAEDGAP